MPTLKEIRQQYPMYSDMSDGDFAKAFHSKFYSDLDFKDFSRKVGYLKGADPSEYDKTSPEYAAKYGPTSAMGAVQRLRAGFGQGMTNLARGAGQAVGLVDRQDIADSRQLDADLNRTTSGKAGNVLGTVAGGIPAAFIPGANTYAGAAAIGAGLGALQPSTSTKETLTNTAAGGVLSPVAMLAGRGLVAGARGLRSALIDPFTKAGQERIASSTLQAFAGGADEAARAAQNIQSGLGNVLPGAKPTTAELANNAGLANLERILKNNPEFTQAFASRAGQNRNAMISAIDEIAGDKALMEQAVGYRGAVADDLYGAARAQGADASLVSKANAETKRTLAGFLRQAGADSAQPPLDPNFGVKLYGPGQRAAEEAARNAEARGISGSLIGEAGALEKEAINTGSNFIGRLDVSDLLKRPAIRSAIAGAKTTAANFGQSVDDANPVSVLHWAKMNLDDAIGAAKRAGNSVEASSLQAAQKALLGKLESISPTYAQARNTFAELSKPINQMEVGQAFRDKLVPAISDFGAQTRINPSAFASAMRNADATAANATGRAGASITDILSPDQMGTLTQVGQQLARRVNADELGRAVGSNTGQNLVGQNVLRQFLGPLGLPQTMTERAASGPLMQGILGAPAKLAEKVTGSIGEPNILRKLVELGLSPEDAIRILSQQINNGPGMLRYQGAVAPIVSGAYSARQ